jgi:hypothetical protein
MHLYETVPGLTPPAALPIHQAGTTFVMAQELSWLDAKHFAVGRWDGSLSIFQFAQSSTRGPVISKAVNTPSSEGVQMITPLSGQMFATSNDDQSVILWVSATGQWTDLVQAHILPFDKALGVANSGASYLTPDKTRIYLIIGHEKGFVTIWCSANAEPLTLLKAVDVRAAHPINPWGIHNVRGIGLITFDNNAGYVVTGSEDGDLCVIRVPDGVILSRTVYNPQAQRGINSLAVDAGRLLVANCAVGTADQNLWFYTIDMATWIIQYRSSARLVVDASRPQVFNFDVIWSGASDWFSATEEGYLWMGTIAENGISITGNQGVTAKLGAAIGLGGSGDLAFVAYDLYEFNI